MEFHGIPCNFKCPNFADMSSSMDIRSASFRWNERFHGIQWNSMELGVGQFQWHKQFHGWGVPWNSMELHGIRGAPISMSRAVPWNSLELGVRQFRWHEQFHAIPWNSMELEVRQFRWHEQFHGIPWNLGCANFAVRRSSIEFHGISWSLKCTNLANTSSSIEFHKIPWNLEWASFEDTSSSIEFHGTWSEPTSRLTSLPFSYAADYDGLGMWSVPPPILALAWWGISLSLAKGAEVGHERPGPNVSRPTSVTVDCQPWIHRIE